MNAAKLENSFMKFSTQVLHPFSKADNFGQKKNIPEYSFKWSGINESYSATEQQEQEKLQGQQL